MWLFDRPFEQSSESLSFLLDIQITSHLDETDLSINSGVIHDQAEASFKPFLTLTLTRANPSVHPEYSTGLISGAGCIPISSTLDRVGPMAKTAYDAALLLQIISGPDPKDEKSRSSLILLGCLGVQR
jgi:hypothetical protein